MNLDIRVNSSLFTFEYREVQSEADKDINDNSITYSSLKTHFDSSGIDITKWVLP